MRRNTLFRTLATLLAVWLPLVSGEPGLLQPCPTHGAGQFILGSSRAASPMAGHGGHGHGAHDAAHHSGRETGGHSCSCIDCCVAGAAVVAAPTLPTLVVSSEVRFTERVLGSVALLPRPGPAFSRPHSTGPPRA